MTLELKGLTDTLVGRFYRLWQSPRVWTVLASFAQRGAGFVASFMVSRWVGPSGLGLYAVTVNTAAAVAQPLMSVFSNGATLSAGQIGHQHGLMKLWWVCARVLLLVIFPLFILFVWGMNSSGVLVQQPVSIWLLWCVGVLIIVGSLTLAIASALLAGIGQFLPLARGISLTALFLISISWPMVAWGGIVGALILAALTSVAVALTALHHIRRPFIPQQEIIQQGTVDPTGVVRHHLWASSPGAFALILQAVVSWLCTIYLVQREQGIEALAVLAVSTQWLTLMLMPVTSWSGMVINELIRSHPDARQGVAWTVVVRLIVRNVAATACVVACISVAALTIERWYGLSDQGLAILIWLNAAPALMGSIFMVLERLYVCRQEQVIWMLCSAAGLLVQLCLTWLWVDRLLWIVPLGLAAGYLVPVVFATGRLLMQTRAR